MMWQKIRSFLTTKESFISAEDLYASFHGWFIKKYPNQPVPSRRRLAEYLKEVKGLHTIRRDGRYGWKGIFLNESGLKFMYEGQRKLKQKGNG